MHIIIAIVLLSFLCASLLREFPRCNALLARYPILLSFVPIWSFFAPTPGMYDYHLLYRGIASNGQVGDWQHAYSPQGKRRAYTFLWNPEKKLNKSVLDLVLELLRYSLTFRNAKQICLSLPYLHILNYITHLSHEKEVTKIQFMILSNSKLHEHKVEFLSNTHTL